MSVAENFLFIQREIAAAAKKYGRNPADITCLAVSKNYSWEHIAPAYQIGCRDFAESRIQEGVPKIAQAPSNIRWHMIGTLQKNKVKIALAHFSLIHSVDTYALAQKISQCSSKAGKVTPILLQVNTSGELTKHGMDSESWRKVFEATLALTSIRIEGLMTIAPLAASEMEIRRCFANLRLLKEELSVRAGNSASLQHLSMGMSHDYPLAIAEGATLLRIGRAIFGDSPQ